MLPQPKYTPNFPAQLLHFPLIPNNHNQSGLPTEPYELELIVSHLHNRSSDNMNHSVSRESIKTNELILLIL
jgi:hypothetical protein